MTVRLNQIIAVEKGAKAAANAAIDKVYHTIQKAEPFSGIARTYKPKDDEGETFPDESTRVQVMAEGLLRDAADAWTRLLDVTATKDWSNTEAMADVVVDGQIIIAAAPVSYLIWLEKQLVSMRTVIGKLPVLDPANEWTTSPTGAWATPTVQTNKSKKIPRNHEVSPATDKHPAQVQVWQEDVVVGHWSTIKYSGAMPQTRIDTLTTRVDTLVQAVKYAREEANGLDVTDRSVGGPLFAYLLA